MSQDTVEDSRALRGQPHGPWLFWSIAFPLLVCGVHAMALWLIPDSTRRWFNGELGPVETVTALLFLIVAVDALRLVVRLGSRPLPMRAWVRVWFFLFVLGGVGMFLEESSYGQHWFGFQTPDYFEAHNKQQEMSLHNLASDIPSRVLRRVMEIGLPIFGILLPAIHLFLRGSYTPGHWPYYVLPKLELTAWILLAASIRPIRNLYESGALPPWLGPVGEFQELLWAGALGLYIRVMSRRLLHRPIEPPNSPS